MEMARPTATLSWNEWWTLCFLVDLPEPTGGDAPAAAAAPAPVAPGAELMSGKSSDMEVPT